MFNEKSKTHQDNVAFIIQSLANKPVTAELFRKILEFNDTSYKKVTVLFPECRVPESEFHKEQSDFGIRAKSGVSFEE